jgi:predicted MPP superfamily phosphohydrolase
MVEAANRQDADLIVISGDLIDGTLTARREDVEPLKGLRSRNGVYVIPGNHEYYFGYPGWMQRFAELGLRPLTNSHAVIARAGAQFVLAGVTDLAAGMAGFPGPDIAKAIEGAPAGSPVILLNHQPREAALAAQAGITLQLSGHTHGGMIRGLDRIVARANNGFVSGLYDVEGMPLYVNNGTALWIGFAVRLGVPSELTTIVLRAA